MDTLQSFYFDLGNVLVHFSAERACQQLGRLFNVAPDQIDLALYRSGLQHAYEIGQRQTADVCETLNRTFRTTARPEEFALAASDMFWLNEECLQLVKELHETGLPLGILSNTCSAHWDFLVKGIFAPYLDYFQLVVLSFEENSMKPETRIYEVALQRANIVARKSLACDLNAGNVMFVDDRSDNVTGAVNAGIDAELFVDSETLRNSLRKRGVQI